MIIFIIYAISAFKITKFTLSYKYILPFIFFMLIYTYLLVSVYLISMVLEFFNSKNKWHAIEYKEDWDKSSDKNGK